MYHLFFFNLKHYIFCFCISVEVLLTLNCLFGEDQHHVLLESLHRPVPETCFVQLELVKNHRHPLRPCKNGHLLLFPGRIVHLRIYEGNSKQTLK